VGGSWLCAKTRDFSELASEKREPVTNGA